MLLVVDSNVVISAALNKGNSLNVFLRNFEIEEFEFIAPNFLILEVGKHAEKIANKSNLSIQESLEILRFIIDQVRFIDDEEFKDKMEEAREILRGHKKDAHYLALSLAKGCNIFSGDKVFKELCPDRVKNPKEILEELNKL